MVLSNHLHTEGQMSPIYEIGPYAMYKSQRSKSICATALAQSNLTTNTVLFQNLWIQLNTAIISLAM